ncbi:hypothetical protein D9611_012025 [Ephemerocybe angulata]|uniref:Uncharacterized protein n=1 Tax=Ephemerocybe angulata TaxID=980116 RepID=A0A8H5AT04_9AGAR|nr:hypothetical protein D9611_012025 [Tulosesus angulatus]
MGFSCSSTASSLLPSRSIIIINFTVFSKSALVEEHDLHLRLPSSLETSSLLLVLLVIRSAQRQSLFTSLRWLPATRRITNTLGITNDLCAF